MSLPIPVSVAYGDGTGPEIMENTLRLMRASGANLAIESIEIGQRFYENGVFNGIPPYGWQNLGRTRLLLKAPTFIPDEDGKISTTQALIEHFGPFRTTHQAWKSHELAAQNVPQIYVAAAYINEGFAFFEPVHGIDAAAAINGVTPGMLQASIMLLEHIGQAEVADKLRKF